MPSDEGAIKGNTSCCASCCCDVGARGIGQGRGEGARVGYGRGRGKRKKGGGRLQCFVFNLTKLCLHFRCVIQVRVFDLLSL